MPQSLTTCTLIDVHTLTACLTESDILALYSGVANALSRRQVHPQKWLCSNEISGGIIYKCQVMEKKKTWLTVLCCQEK